MHSIDPANIDWAYIEKYKHVWHAAVEEAYGCLIGLATVNLPAQLVERAKEFRKPFLNDEMRPQVNAFNAAMPRVAAYLAEHMTKDKIPTIDDVFAGVKCDL